MRLLKRLGISLICLAVVAVAVFLWLRQSSLFALNELKIKGAHGPEAAQIRGAIRSTAQGANTLNIDEGAIRDALKRFPSVGGVKFKRDLPHGLTVYVTTRDAVLTVKAGGQNYSVAADGRVLGNYGSREKLPSYRSKNQPVNSRFTDRRDLQAIALAAAAPREVISKLDRIWLSKRGFAVEVSSGPTIYFGLAKQLNLKWQAALRVLADPATAGATYVDVQVPERPALGGLGEDPSETTDQTTDTPVVPQADPNAAPVEPVVPEPVTPTPQ